MRKDGDRRLSLDDALREIELRPQIIILDRKFHLRFPPPSSHGFKPATVPCFTEGIKIVVVVVHAQKRISLQGLWFKRHRLWRKRGVLCRSEEHTSELQS